MESNDNTILLHVSFRGASHDLSLPSSAPLSELLELLEDLTSVPSTGQKLLYKGKKSTRTIDWSISIEEAGLKNGMKVQMIGSTPEEMSEMQKAEMEKQRRDRIMAGRARKGAAKARSTGISRPKTYIFHNISPLPHLPHPELALTLLNKLAADPAIQHIMTLHQFSVGLLTELAPHEHPNLLGLNENRGEKIKLRVRTDRYDGLRNYGDVRRVLCHELTHCVWGDHDNNFKELNSLLNRQVAEYEASVRASSQTLSSYAGLIYDPATSASLGSPQVEAEAFAHRLGGGESATALSNTSTADDSPQARRQRILAATLRRLEKGEQEIEDMCGSVNVAAGDTDPGSVSGSGTGVDTSTIIGKDETQRDNN